MSTMIESIAKVNPSEVNNEKIKTIISEFITSYGERCFTFPQSMYGLQSGEEFRKKLKQLGFHDEQLPPQQYWESIETGKVPLPEVSRNICILTPIIEGKNIREKTIESVFSIFPREFDANDSYRLIIRLPTLTEFTLLAKEFHCLSESIYTATNTIINGSKKEMVFTGNINAGGTGCYEPIPVTKSFPDNAALYLLIEIVPKNTQTKNEQI